MRNAVLVLVLLTSQVHADDYARSPTAATWLSLGTTAAGTVMFATGLVLADSNHAKRGLLAGGFVLGCFGPSVGHLYGAWPNFDTDDQVGPVMRVGALALLLFGSLAIYGVPDDAASHSTKQDHAEYVLLGVSGALFASGVIYDIATAGDTVRRGNIALRPAFANGPGIALSGAF